MPLQQRAQIALADVLRSKLGEVALDSNARVERLEDNLVQGVTPQRRAEVERQLAQGDGGELLERDGQRPKLHSAFSSAALAVNVFAPWLGRESDLELAGARGFELLEFERKCAIGVRGKTPNLDVVAVGSNGVVAVESKCTEHLAAQKAKFSHVYDSRVSALAQATWQAEYEALRRDSRLYTFLNAAQLVKHYLGLKNTFAGTACTLLYLYWEPANAGDHPELVRHETEVQAFSAAVADPGLPFVGLSYSELFDRWSTDAPPWLETHVTSLRQRYEVEVQPGA